MFNLFLKCGIPGHQKIREYIQLLEENQIKIWRLYLYGSYARNSYDNESDIDLAVFFVYLRLVKFASRVFS